MQAIVNRTLRSAHSVETAQRSLKLRLVSPAGAHGIPTQGAWEGTTLGKIVAKATAPFQTGAASRFHIQGPQVRRPPWVFLVFPMALHALATNAVKHGTLSNGHARSALNGHWWTRTGPRRWDDVDGLPVTAPTRTGFGSRKVERAPAPRDRRPR
ncbi:HWE histidine kinase domain-containing protein [uncultured Methylobacterium sp.]|uniref:HWE histidine kinase domain-containing protein n=1 Tax=uncultured Methylobacterium sp. TaxID=157278 RepID=UPI0035CA9975